MSTPPDAEKQHDDLILDPDIFDPEILVFSGGSALPAGTTVQHGPGRRTLQLFGKRKEAVSANWAQVTGQMRDLISHVDTLAGSYELSEIQFKLGFSAEGTVVFIAKGGIEATISATFRRKGAPEGEQAAPAADDE